MKINSSAVPEDMGSIFTLSSRDISSIEVKQKHNESFMKKTEQTVLKTNSYLYEHFNEQQFYKRSIEKTL